MLKPLICNPDDPENSFKLIPGKFYRYKESSFKGISIWKHPNRWIGKSRENILGFIKPWEPFMFANNEIERGDGRSWVKVVYSDVIGYLLISPFNLHMILERVTSDE
jgi:hypothetical protein